MEGIHESDGELGRQPQKGEVTFQRKEVSHFLNELEVKLGFRFLREKLDYFISTSHLNVSDEILTAAIMAKHNDLAIVSTTTNSMVQQGKHNQGANLPASNNHQNLSNNAGGSSNQIQNHHQSSMIHLQQQQKRKKKDHHNPNYGVMPSHLPQPIFGTTDVSKTHLQHNNSNQSQHGQNANQQHIFQSTNINAPIQMFQTQQPPQYAKQIPSYSEQQQITQQTRVFNTVQHLPQNHGQNGASVMQPPKGSSINHQQFPPQVQQLQQQVIVNQNGMMMDSQLNGMAGSVGQTIQSQYNSLSLERQLS
ncbi:UNKNOWN [Stylonychia lemnae]|uniref:Uncharacterized protein n=1 Tax=Stylonychia lemnae TaxID=5949 RepID=A0A077ZP72_STYLE|nr:UNKNOWN [Stylonychia lemnae]|eukprot:CDW71762.1 UNKNOWN [Stylonychia lemnae]